MKRYSGLHDKLCTIENIEVADEIEKLIKKNLKLECVLIYDWRIYTKNRKENIKPQI